MLKKKLRKTVLLSTALLLITTSLAACAGTGNNPSSQTEGTTTPATTDGESAKEIVELDLFVDQSWWPLKDWSGPIPEEITKRSGVKLNVTVATDDKQLPVMIASGDLPDLVVTNAQWQRLSDPDLAYDWQELIDKYSLDFEIDPEKIAVNTASDGKFYTIRNNFSPKAEWEANQKYALTGAGGINMRADILEEIGNPKIETLDDFKNVLETVKTKYPDMIPLVVNPYWYKNYFQLQFGAEGWNWLEEDGKLVFPLHSKKTENMYMYMNELYRKGYIKSETYSYKSEDQSKQLMTSGKGFAYTWVTGGADILTSATEEAGFKFVNAPMKISDDFKKIKSDTGWQGVFITKGNKNPEASIKLMQFLLSEEGQQLAMWGRKGTDWNMSPDGGYPVFTYNRNDDNVKNQMGVSWWGLLAGSAVTEALAGYTPGTENTRSNQELAPLITYDAVFGLVNPDADSQEQVVSTNLQNLIKNEEFKVLMANSEAEAKAAFDNMGMNDFERWGNEKYAKLKAELK
jgi:putative aldouronate transport system substrate-binding protein